MGEKCTVIVLAAGQGKRMKTKIQKQFLSIQGHPVLYYSLRCFQECEWMDEIILVTGQESLEYCRKEIVEKYQITKVAKIIPGGKERYDSVYQGLLACADTDYVFVHDGARPMITEDILDRAFAAVRECGACVVGVPSKDTVKVADSEGYVSETPSRELVWNVQTPQVFSYNILREAHENIRKRKMHLITDDAMVVEQEGRCKVKLVLGSYENIKITTPEDLEIADIIIKNREFRKNEEKQKKTCKSILT